MKITPLRLWQMGVSALLLIPLGAAAQQPDVRPVSPSGEVLTNTTSGIKLDATGKRVQSNPATPPEATNQQRVIRLVVSPTGEVLTNNASGMTSNGIKKLIQANKHEAANSDPVSSPDNKVAPTPANGLAAEIAGMRLDRTPDALFQAVKSKQAGGKLTEAERFRIAVLLGDWEAVGKTLKALPVPEGKQVYNRLLESLASSSQSAAQFYQQTAGTKSDDPEASQGSSAASARSRRCLLLSEDFYAVMAASPTDLEASQLKSVSSLVKIAIGQAGKKEFLKRLEAGLKGMGGSKPEGHKFAAGLLSSLEWIADAGPYLPLKREEWRQAETPMLILTMEHYTQTGIQTRDERLVKSAAELCAFMMQTSRFGENDRGLFRQATDRFVKLLPALETSDAEQLIRENFLTQPAILAELILTLGESGQQAQLSPDVNLRGQSLVTQSVLLRVLAGRKSALPESANVLIMNWLTEAETTYRSNTTMPIPDDSDSSFVFRSSLYNAPRRDSIRTITADVILTNAPPAALIRGLNAGLAQRIKLTLLKVNLMDPKDVVTLELLTEYLKEHPGQEKELCQDYLAAWVRKRSVRPVDPNIARMQRLGYNITSQQQAAPGIPLTRLRQNKNVGDFRHLISALRVLSPDGITPAVIVQSFMAIHSSAEVYRLSDIEAIFGPAEKMNRAELMQLVTGMRTKLREQWRDPKTQQTVGTNRTEDEAKNEVSRGYRTAIDLVKRGLTREGADWQQFIVRGQIFFDASEFEFSRQIKLTDYVNLRDEAFNSYKQAAQIYAAKVPDLAHGQWTLDPYQMWFYVMLGASDLSQLTRTAARSDPGLSQIGDALRALPGEAAEGHLRKFGEMLGGTLSQVPPNLRQHFLNSGLQVVGADHPAAKIARASLENYQALLDETQLRVTVDGPTSVGHGQAFGMMLGLEHTRQIGRESGGFAKYLQNAAQSPFSSAPAAKHLDNFTKNIHAALDETFEVVSVTFPDAGVRAIDLAREGWQETPLAYVLLRAKGAAVDRIPSIQLDMDFSDTSGQVVLPVLSQVQPIDAKATESAPRPCAALALTFTMDEREWMRDGRVAVEVTAKGRGVIPTHTQLFDFAQAAFDVEVADNGLSITEFVSDGKAKLASADRNWLFTYKRKKDARGDVVLKFPAVKAAITTASVEFQHYQDADLIKLDAKQAAAGVTLNSATSSRLRTALIAIVLAALAGGAFLMLRKRGGPPKGAEESLTLPSHITPFSVVAFLRRIQHLSGGKLDESARQSLKKQIEEIEAAFFRGVPASSGAPDLDAVARKWWQAAR